MQKTHENVPYLSSEILRYFLIWYSKWNITNFQVEKSLVSLVYLSWYARDPLKSLSSSDTPQSINVRHRPKHFIKTEFILRCGSKWINQRVKPNWHCVLNTNKVKMLQSDCISIFSICEKDRFFLLAAFIAVDISLC